MVKRYRIAFLDTNALNEVKLSLVQDMCQIFSIWRITHVCCGCFTHKVLFIYLFIFMERTNKGATESLQSQVEIVGNILNLRCFLNIYCYVIIRYWALAEREREREKRNQFVNCRRISQISSSLCCFPCLLRKFLFDNQPTYNSFLI